MFDFITISQGMRGWFAVHMWFNTVDEPGGFYEPWNSSPLAFRTKDEAIRDAIQWAHNEGIPFKE